MSTVLTNACESGQVLAELINFANQELLASAEDITVTVDTPLLEMGVLDSLTMVSLLAFIQTRLHVNVPDEEVLPEHFETLGTMAELIGRLQSRNERTAESEDGSSLLQSIRILESAGIRRRWVPVAGGAQMHALEVSGEQPAWILLPGLGNPSSSWGAVLRSLNGETAAIAPDLLGFGVSHSAEISPDFAAQLRAVRELIETTAEQRFVLVGSSAGSLLAAEIARQAPERVAALVITGFGLIEDPPAWRRMLATLSASPDRFLAAAYHRPPKLTQALRDLFSDVMNRPAYDAFLEGRGLEAMSCGFYGLHVPTLFVAGQQDQIIPAAAAQIPGASIEWLARCGHFPPSEQPEELVFFIRSFLKKTGIR